MDLRDPENVKTAVEYDIKTGTYVVRTRLGDKDLTTPISLTPEEYQDYSMQQSLRSYYRQKNEEEFQKEADKNSIWPICSSVSVQRKEYSARVVYA